MELTNLEYAELIELVSKYNAYIQNANEDDVYATGWRPVSISEFYNNEFQEEE